MKEETSKLLESLWSPRYEMEKQTKLLEEILAELKKQNDSADFDRMLDMSIYGSIQEAKQYHEANVAAGTVATDNFMLRHIADSLKESNIPAAVKFVPEDASDGEDGEAECP